MLEKNLDKIDTILESQISNSLVSLLSEDKTLYSDEPLNKEKVSCGCNFKKPTTVVPTDFKSGLASLTKHMLDQGLEITPLPKLILINDDQENFKNLLGKTAYYNPNNCSITLYTLGRHPKDILRSYAHEMVHRIQDNQGRLTDISTTNTNEDGSLEELEKEAYLEGNMIFRKWEDSIKNI